MQCSNKFWIWQQHPAKFRMVKTVLVFMTADYSSCLRFFELPRSLQLNDAQTHIIITIILIIFVIYNRLYTCPVHLASLLIFFSRSFRNFFVFFVERDVFCPTASCSWVSGFSAQVEHWDLGGLASLARAAPVRLGDFVLFLSCQQEAI